VDSGVGFLPANDHRVEEPFGLSKTNSSSMGICFRYEIENPDGGFA
jgi:hypothetical protein